MDAEKILTSWVTLQSNIMDLDEEELSKLLEVEKNGENRLSFLGRIQGRINKLRSRRESMEALS